MLTTLACTLALGMAPATLIAPKFDITLKSLTVENPLDGELRGDFPFGAVVIASCDPKNPKVLGKFSFQGNDGMKRNATAALTGASAKGIEIPSSERDYFIHVAAMERDDLLQTAGVDSIFFNVHTKNLAAYAQQRFANKLSITTQLRQDFREELRKGISITKILADDDDIVQIRDFSFSKREMELAASPAGFEKDFQFVKLSVPTNQARYRLKFRIERSK